MDNSIKNDIQNLIKRLEKVSKEKRIEIGNLNHFTQYSRVKFTPAQLIDELRATRLTQSSNTKGVREFLLAVSLGVNS